MFEQDDTVPIEEPTLDLVPSLRQLTAIKICVSLWQHECTKALVEFDESLLATLKETIDTCLNVPKALKAQVASTLEPTLQELSSWLRYHGTVIFDWNCDSNALYRACILLGNVSWNSLGKVEREESAKRMIGQRDLLTTEEAYRMACVYCFEKVVYEFGALLRDCIDAASLSRYPLLCYWTRKLVGNWETLPPHWTATGASLPAELCNANDDPRYMLRTRQVAENESAFAYLWRSLPEEADRHDALEEAIRCGVRLKNLRVLLRDMRDIYRTSLLANYGDELLRHFVNAKPVHEAYFAWMAFQTRNLISAPQLCNVLTELAGKLMANVEYERYASMLRTLWTYVPQRLRESLFVDEYENAVMRVLINVRVETHAHMLRLTLRDADPEFRKRVLCSRYGHYVCVELIATGGNGLQELESFVRSVLVTAEEMDEFRVCFVGDKKFEVATRLLVDEEKFGQFEEFAKWAFPGESDGVVKEEFLKEVPERIFATALNSVVAGVEESTVAERTAGLQRLLEACFGTDEEEVAKFKVDFMFARSAVRMVMRHRSDAVVRGLVRWFLQDEEHVARFREVFKNEEVSRIV